MKITCSMILFSLFIATVEPVMAIPTGRGFDRFGKFKGKSGNGAKTTNKSSVVAPTADATTSVADSTPIATSSIVEVPPVGADVPPVVAPPIPTSPTTDTQTETAVASPTPTDGGILADDPPPEGQQPPQDGVDGNNNVNEDNGDNEGNNNGNNEDNINESNNEDNIDANKENKNGGRNGGGNNGGNDQGGNDGLTLLKANVQDASSKTGQEDQQTDGQANSLQDSANHINFCTGKQLTNGQQGRTPGSGPFCNGIPMGDIPDRTKMISSIITFPTFGTTLKVGEPFEITVKTRGLSPGTFTNPDLTYYSAPQQLDNSGQIIGHTHVTVQLLDAIDTSNVPDPDKFEFFKGINDAGDGQGNLKAAVTNGLPIAGIYRVCTMTSAGNHQPVLMPVAQRGAQDDCVRFTVGGDGNGNDGGVEDGGNEGGDNDGGDGGRKGRNRTPRNIRSRRWWS